MRIPTRSLAIVTTHAWSSATAVETLNHIVEVCYDIIHVFYGSRENRVFSTSWIIELPQGESLNSHIELIKIENGRDARRRMNSKYISSWLNFSIDTHKTAAAQHRRRRRPIRQVLKEEKSFNVIWAACTDSHRRESILERRWWWFYIHWGFGWISAGRLCIL